MGWLSRLKPPRWARKLQPGRILEPVVRAIPGGSSLVDTYNNIESRVKKVQDLAKNVQHAATNVIDQIKAEAKARGVSPADVALEKGQAAVDAFNQYEGKKKEYTALAVVGGVVIVVLLVMVVRRRR